MICSLASKMLCKDALLASAYREISFVLEEGLAPFMVLCAHPISIIVIICQVTMWVAGNATL